MANRYIISASMPAYNHYAQDDNYNYLQPATYLIRFNVCKITRNPQICVCIDSRASSTIKQLKEQIVLYLDISLPLNQFFLEIFDEAHGQWEKIDNSYSSSTIKELNLRPDSTLSIGYCEQEVSKDRRFIHSTPSSNNNRELILKICTKPMDTTDWIYLTIHSSFTLGKLRKHAYERFNQSSKDHPIYVLKKDSWMKFDSDMDDQVLADLFIESYTFISIDCDEDNSSSKSPSGLCGLANLGSTCFMNSVFQCLSNIPEFTNKIAAFNDEVNAPIIGEYIKLIKQIWSGKYRFIEPSSLLNNIKDHSPHYASYRQQDAQEFMNDFLHLIHAEFSTKETIITDLFYGQIQSTVKCLVCKQSEIRKESISFLPLPISNHNLKTILYIKADGEQRLVSVQVNSYVTDITDLIDCFIKQHEPTFTRKRIQAVGLVDNCVKELYETWKSLRDIRDEELAFLECPGKSTHQDYIWCNFLDRSTGKAFRPPSILVCPTYVCRYTHLSEQIDQLLGHLCSMTGASMSDCYLLWRDRNKKQYKLTAEASNDENLPHVEAIIIEMTSKWTDIYKQLYDFNHSTDNSGLCSLLADFFREEPLHGDYQCLKCSRHTKARKKSDLCLPLPRVIIIQLKRFTYDIHSNDKIDTFISFPLDGLDLNEYIFKDDTNKNEKNASTIYHLVAVSNHTGSLTSGHYTTYAKNIRDEKWYSFDDKFVKKLDSDNDVVTKNAYILVYVKKD